MGASGAGKTDSLATFLEAGIELFHLGTEPGACEVLIDSCKRRGLDISRLHFHQMKLAAMGWKAMTDNIATVGALSHEALTKLNDISKKEMSHFMEFLNQCKNFHDQRTGKDFGDVTTWNDSRAFAVDSLSGLNRMAREYVVGYKPTMHQGEWGVAMQLEENVMYKLISDRSCYLVLIAHVDREVDEVFGGVKITMSALGRKLAPQLVKFFSEVVLAKHEGDQFYWSTSEILADVKSRALPIGSKLTPSFVPLVRAHQARLSALRPPEAKAS